MGSGDSSEGRHVSGNSPRVLLDIKNRPARSTETGRRFADWRKRTGANIKIRGQLKLMREPCRIAGLNCDPGNKKVNSVGLTLIRLIRPNATSAYS